MEKKSIYIVSYIFFFYTLNPNPQKCPITFTRKMRLKPLKNVFLIIFENSQHKYDRTSSVLCFQKLLFVRRIKYNCYFDLCKIVAKDHILKKIISFICVNNNCFIRKYKKSVAIIRYFACD